MDKEDEQTLRHLIDLSRTSYSRNIDVYSDFLNMHDIAILKANSARLSTASFYLWGGASGCERAMVCFPASYTADIHDAIFPISCLCIRVRGARFSMGSLTHRDYMGAVLGLGIERRLIGDIIVDSQTDKPGAYLFCSDRIRDFILDELRQIGRSEVDVSICDPAEVTDSRTIEDKTGTVPSLRLDAVVGEVFGLSRTKAKELIESGLVSVDSAQVEMIHYQLRDGNVISARGYGKFVFYGEDGQTKKDRVRISYGIYR